MILEYGNAGHNGITQGTYNMTGVTYTILGVVLKIKIGSSLALDLRISVWTMYILEDRDYRKLHIFY